MLRALALSLLLPLALLLGVGCATSPRDTATQPSEVDLGQGVSLRLRPPREALPELQLVQHLTFQHGDMRRSLEAVLTHEKGRLTLVALLPFGGEAFRIEFEDQTMRTRSLPQSLEGFDPKYMLGDLYLVYTDAEQLRTWLSPQARLQARALQREIDVGGKPLVRIRFSERDRFRAEVHYENVERGYKIHIRPLSGGVKP